MNLRTTTTMALLAGLLGLSRVVYGADGVWTSKVSGSWSTTANWTNGVVASGAGMTADFSTATAGGTRTVTLDAEQTIGNLKFAEPNSASTADWILTNSVLTLSTSGVGTPTLSFSTKPLNYSQLVNLYIYSVLAGSEGLLTQPLAGKPVVATVYLCAQNTYAGGTTIANGSWVEVANAGALPGVTTVKAGGMLEVASSVTFTNSIVAEGGAILGSHVNTGGTHLGFTNGIITLQGGMVTVVVWRLAVCMIFDRIEESVPESGLSFIGWFSGSGEGGRAYLYASNSFTGPVVIRDGPGSANPAGEVDVYNPDALGSGTNWIVVSSANSKPAKLVLYATAGLTTNRTVWVGPNGYFGLGANVTSACPVIMSGGSSFFPGGGNRWTIGSITLAAGTTSFVGRTNGRTTSDNWYQDGVISGDGALSLVLAGANDACPAVHFRGTNTYTGGTYVQNTSSFGNQDNRARLYNDRSLGAGPVWLDGTTTYPSVLQLQANCTMSNAFRGRGTVKANGFTLTTTGSLAPYDTGLGAAATSNLLGTLTIETLKFGTDAQGCAYNWQYDATTNDIVASTTLSFGKTAQTINCAWLGGGTGAEGTYALFTYAGSDPDMSGVTWVVNAPPKLSGRVTLNTTLKQVQLKLNASTRGTAVFFH